MESYLTTPVVAFAIVFVAVALLALLLSRAGAKPSKEAAGKTKAYSCGETMQENRAQPDYQQFFPFAFFFTIMHVVALLVATLPATILPSAFFVGGLYILSIFVGLIVLYRS
jgi:NADH-quinone oxidoreductase subunit A